MSKLLVLSMGILFGLSSGCTYDEKSNSTMTTQYAHTNRLVKEKSPYLLQHAHNPVDWYPWGDEAFAKAVREDKPIFLSIGYSTCHWCHVMEHESFEDDAVADLMNRNFVCIKVDREERPDIDQIYMKACMMLVGQGGWPLTIVMTPDKHPFFAGTYFPKEGRLGRGGMMQLLPAIGEAWRDERAEIMGSVARITNAMTQAEDMSGVLLNQAVLDEAYGNLSSSFDSTNGGFGSSPKFPSPHNLSFLLHYGKRMGDTQAVAMVEATLQAMHNGGVYDHVGFGFHRYSTDAQWKLPHFEKMLYDQAMMTLASVDAYQATGNEAYKKTASEVITYVLRDLRGKEGAFYSAEDADSEGEEGKFYVWTVDELKAVLSPDEAQAVMAYYSVSESGNFTDEASGHQSGANILFVQQSLKTVAGKLNVSPEQLQATIEAARQKLLAVRSKRVRPHLDDKILADWNGLMIAAMARASGSFGNEDYRRDAATAAAFVLDRMRDKQGRLLHRYRDGHMAVPGVLDDYAFMTWGLIELYEAGYDPKYLQCAIELTDHMIRHFWDQKNGAFYFTADDAEKLITREKETYDGAAPSGNSVAFLNLLRLGALTGRPEYLKMADKMSTALSKSVRSTPSAHCQLLMATDYALGPSYEVVIVGKKGADDTDAMLTALRSKFLPNVSVHLVDDTTRAVLVKLAPFTEGHKMVDGKATAYVCKQWACELPTTDPAKMLKLLGEK